MLCSPIVAGDLVYVGSIDGIIYAVNAATGQVAWKYQLEGGMWSSLTIAGGVVYAGSLNGNLYALK